MPRVSAGTGSTLTAESSRRPGQSAPDFPLCGQAALAPVTARTSAKPYRSVCILWVWRAGLASMLCRKYRSGAGMALGCSWLHGVWFWLVSTTWGGACAAKAKPLLLTPFSHTLRRDAMRAESARHKRPHTRAVLSPRSSRETVDVTRQRGSRHHRRAACKERKMVQKNEATLYPSGIHSLGSSE
jgi:hypothetical protein